MLEKMYTTKMSMDKKKLQNRFSKIRSKNGKTSKFIAMAVFAVIIVSIICVSIFVAVNMQDDKVVYKNEKMNIQFEIPNDWQGKYIIDETLEDNGYIIIKHKGIAEKYEGAGMLCSVYKEPDETVDATLNALGNQTVVWQNQDYAYIVGRPTDVQHPIWADSDEEDSVLASEYEKMAKDITHIESTFSLINDVDVPVITNAENLSYAQIRDLQRQVDNGHFPWRLDYEQVMQSYISGQGENVEGGSLVSFAGDDEKCSGTDEVGNYRYLIELFRPIDKTEHGIWIVRSYKKIEPATMKDISFYNINPNDNTLGAEIVKQEDGWYQLPSIVSSFINFNGAIPESVTAYFTPAGTDMKKLEKQVGYAEPPFPQIPISIKLTFSKEDTRGHLLFVFKYEDGTLVQSELFNVLVEN